MPRTRDLPQQFLMDIDDDEQNPIDEAIEQFNQKANNLVRLALSKRGVLKRDEINKRLNLGRGQFKNVLNVAQERLKKVFGLKLERYITKAVIDQRNKDKVEEPDLSQETAFILVSCLSPELQEVAMSENLEKQSENGILVLMLILIYVNGGILSEQSLNNQLQKFGFSTDVKGQRRHEMYGLIEPTIDSWVKSGYFEKTAVSSNDAHSQNEWKWGPRALAEFQREQINEMLLQIFGDQVNKRILRDVESLGQ